MRHSDPGQPLAATGAARALAPLDQLGPLLAASAVALALASAAAAQDADVQAEIVPMAEWTYDDLYADGIRVDELVGGEVIGPSGEDIGDVENVLFDQDGRVLSVIAEVGGFLELGDTHVSIPWGQVEVRDDGEEVVVPLTQETIEDYTLFTDDVISAEEAATEVQEVAGDNVGVAGTGPRVWRATELIGDYARLRDGEGVVNYGYVDDIVVRGDQIAAVLVSPDVGQDRYGLYGYPFHGYAAGFEPGREFYDLPYDRTEVEALEPIDEDQL